LDDLASDNFAIPRRDRNVGRRFSRNTNGWQATIKQGIFKRKASLKAFFITWGINEYK
jgi:hypothetical protein